MIANELQLRQSIELMERKSYALAALHTEVFPKNRQQFALMAEGPLEELRRLEQEVSVYIDQTLDVPANSASSPEPTVQAA